MSDQQHVPYERPTLARFGTFRDLTRIGANTGGDISAIFGINAGCDASQSGAFGCSGGRS
jgi:hypothetical protein